MTHFPAPSSRSVILGIFVQGVLAMPSFACSRPEPADKNTSGLTRHTTPMQSPKVVLPPFASTLTTPSVRESDNAAPPSDLAARLGLALTDARSGGKGRVTYTPPTPTQFRDYREFIALSLTNGGFSSTPVPTGFQTVSLHEQLDLLTEQRDAKRGAGVAVLRKGPSSPLCIEVPHSFFDEGTLDIGLQLFLRSKAQLFLINTAHRYRTSADRPPPRTTDSESEPLEANRSLTPAVDTVSSDVAHANTSFFLAAHEAFVDTNARSTTIQVHGFADASAPQFDVVASAARSKARLSSLVDRLRTELGLRVALYPDDTRKLGGTTNVEAKYSRVKRSCFVHLELSETLRVRLTSDPNLMNQFAIIVPREAHCD